MAKGQRRKMTDPSKDKSIPELKKAVQEEKAKALYHAYCLDRGWKSLCRRFRAHLNTLPQSEDFEKWMYARIALAHEFFEKERIPRAMQGALVDHVPITKMRGYRKCLKCMTR